MGRLTITRCTHTRAKLCDKCQIFNALESLRVALTPRWATRAKQGELQL